jgi:hypothetical protein
MGSSGGGGCLSRKSFWEAHATLVLATPKAFASRELLHLSDESFLRTAAVMEGAFRLAADRDTPTACRKAMAGQQITHHLRLLPDVTV